MRFKDTRDVVIISEANAHKLIDQARPHWKLPLRILYYYGMRASELLSLTSNNFRDGVFVLQRTKRGELTRQDSPVHQRRLARANENEVARCVAVSLLPNQFVSTDAGSRSQSWR
jgi:integrase